MSMAQLLALVLCAFCLTALLLGQNLSTWVRPSRRATRRQVLLFYRVAAVIVPLIIGELAQRSAHAQSPVPGAGASATSPETTTSDPQSASETDGSRRSFNLNEEEPAPESLRDLASRVLLDLGLGAGHRLRVGRLTLVYEAPVTEAQAVALGEFLSRSEVGDRGSSSGTSRYGQVQVQLRKSSPTAATPEAYEVRIATQFAHRQELDPETKAAYQMMGLVASGIAFEGAPVHIHVCNALLRPLLVLRPQLAAAPAATALPNPE